MEELLAVIGVLTPPLSGLTFLAYKHPKAYEKLFVPLLVILLAVLFGVGVWDVSNAVAHNAVLTYVRPEKIDEASKAITDKMSWSPYILLVASGLCYYLLFLLALPSLMGGGKATNEETGK